MCYEVFSPLIPQWKGEATAVYLARLLKPAGRQDDADCNGHSGAAIFEFADEVTMSKSLENRREM